MSTFSTLLTQLETNVDIPHPVGLKPRLRRQSGFLWTLREIATSSPRLEALIFGPGDYAASMQMPLTDIGAFDEYDALYPGHRWHGVMHTIVAAARANGLRCMDGPYANFRDESGLVEVTKVPERWALMGNSASTPHNWPR
ncbi:MAG: aldolase/citrate lyase family protein [Caldilineaceae bacterium]